MHTFVSLRYSCHGVMVSAFRGTIGVYYYTPRGGAVARRRGTPATKQAEGSEPTSHLIASSLGSAIVSNLVTN